MSASPPWYGWPPTPSESSPSTGGDPSVGSSRLDSEALSSPGPVWVPIINRTIALTEARAVMVWGYITVVLDETTIGVQLRLLIDGVQVAIAGQAEGAVAVNEAFHHRTDAALAIGDHTISLEWQTTDADVSLDVTAELSAMPVNVLAFAATPPVADAGPDATYLAFSAKVLAGGASGGIPPYTYLWTQLSAPPDSSIDLDDNTDPVSGFVLNGVAGAYVLDLQVTDSVLSVAHDQVTFTAEVLIDWVAGPANVLPAGSFWSIGAYSPALDLFVLGSSGAAVFELYSSPTGAAWTLRQNLGAHGSRCMCWAPISGVFVVMTSTVNWTSPDGIVWTSHVYPGTFPNSVIESPDGHIIVADRGTFYRSADAGATWAIIAAPDAVPDWTALASDGTNLTASIGVSSTAQPVTAAKSTDNGASWVAHVLPGVTANDAPQAGVYTPDLGIFQLIGFDNVGGAIPPFYKSADGTTWVANPSGVNDAYFYSLINVPVSVPFLLSGGDENTTPENLAVTFDGVTWQTMTGPDPIGGWIILLYSPSQNTIIMASWNGPGSDIWIGTPAP